LETPSLALLECRSLARGAKVSDEILKTAPVRLLLSYPVSPGKLLVAFCGGVAEVEASLERGLEICGEQLEDALFLPAVHPGVTEALHRRLDARGVEAMGVVETYTVSAALRAADASLKASAVRLLSLRLGAGIGGKAVYYLSGAVADVEAAVEAGVEAIRIPELLVETVVLARPHGDFIAYLDGGPGQGDPPAGLAPNPEED
jgi:microcompartment protein CcmL/EutN